MNIPAKKENRNLLLPFRAGGEKLLQYIWQFQYFNKSELQTTAGEKLQIIFPGKLNSNQGADFSNAQIKIDNTILAGSVELHLKASQWNEHGHSNDPNYRNVILHVVFENDIPIASVPVLELQSRISNLLLDKYADLMNSVSFIPCANAVSKVKEITWLSWKERLLAERLTRKSSIVFKFLEENNAHWEESFWWMLARNFGMKVNSDAFESMARSIPVNILAKHKNQIHQLEAMLFGQVGLLNENFNEDYPKLLQREYNFLKKKYEFRPIHSSVHFLRMRPGNFPTIRLSQLAALIQNSAYLFSKILETEKVSEAKKLFDVTANDYWHYHYRFDEASGFRKKVIGKDMTGNVVVNTIVPVLFAYGLYHKEEKYKNKALRWLEELSSEVNTITKGFTSLKLSNKSAFDSQSLIELKTQYCEHKRCLQCALGNAILRIT
ncbi:MAG TPA: DUF2851 family protein [Flavisolibacter sp.]|jgi:hypothetical protein|nr:DUF2851 family protein [Flavisolibacter sp.]